MSKATLTRESMNRRMSIFYASLVVLAVLLQSNCMSNNGQEAIIVGRSTESNSTAHAGVPKAKEQTKSPAAINPTGPSEVVLAPQSLRAKNSGELIVNVALPEGYHLNEEAPQHYEAEVTEGAMHLSFARGAKSLSLTSKNLGLPLRLPLTAQTAGAALVRVSFKVYYCSYERGGSCRVKTLVWNVPVEVTTQDGAPRQIKTQSEITL